MADCLFCGIVAGEVPSEKVYEDDEVLAFRDINPQAPHHVLVIPKKHIASLAEAGDEDAGLLAKVIIKVRDIAADLGLDEEGYRMVVNCGPNGGQTVGHLHFHLLGGRRMTWPPG